MTIEKRNKWNAGWLGLQLGGSLWILGVIFVAPSPASLVSVSAVVVFMIINLIGSYMWMRSDRLPIDIAQRIFVGVVALGSFSMLVITDVSGVLGSWEPSLSNPRQAYWIMLMFPFLIWVLGKQRGKDKMDEANKASQDTSLRSDPER